MPFIHLVNNHNCSKPATRDDGSKLGFGDIWKCDATTIVNVGNPVLPTTRYNGTCGKTWEWTSDPREQQGGYWMRVNA